MEQTLRKKEERRRRRRRNVRQHQTGVLLFPHALFSCRRCQDEAEATLEQPF